ncbi:MAG: rhodanese-like domain-containing protein [Alphaproteobacteria bacterium]|nr:rhodanese-like domain-containing protein [Alphaproteobacteria bacterium]
MKLSRTEIISAVAAGLMATLMQPALAAEEPSDPKKQTPWGLYLTASEAYEMKQLEGDEVLFIDVRDPVEIMFTGFTDVVDVNVPFLLSNPGKWNAKKSVLLMEPNPDYVDGVRRAMEARGLGKDTPVMVMCRSGGTRGAPSAKALAPLGLERVYVVVDGFEGGAVKDHPKGPWRLKNGWKNSGLPWSYKLNKDKIYFRPDQG